MMFYLVIKNWFLTNQNSGFYQLAFGGFHQENRGIHIHDVPQIREDTLW